MRVLPFAARMRSACTAAALSKTALSPSHLVGSARVSVSSLLLCGERHFYASEQLEGAAGVHG
jgi:hypothetical protein